MGRSPSPHLHGEAALVLPPALHARGRLPGLLAAVCGGEGAGVWLGVSAKRTELQVCEGEEGGLCPPSILPQGQQ